MPDSWNRSRLTEKLVIEYPLVQGPRGGPIRRSSSPVARRERTGIQLRLRSSAKNARQSVTVEFSVKWRVLRAPFGASSER
jgi:hypothetical protein